MENKKIICKNKNNKKNQALIKYFLKFFIF